MTYLAGEVAIVDLQETKEHPDISFLSKELEIKAEKIEYLVVSHRLQALSKIDAAFFYALFRENTLLKNDFAKLLNTRLSIGINTDLQSLLYDAALADPKTIQKDVTAAVKEMIVASNVSKECKRNIELLRKYKAPAEEYYKNELPKKVLDTISGFISGNKIQEIGKLFSEHKNDLNTFFEKITDPSFFNGIADAADAETSIALGQLLGFGNGIVPHVIKSKKITKPGDIKKLAKLNKAGWVEELTKLKGKKALNASDKNEISLSASVLTRNLERKFPTMAFTAIRKRKETDT
ncbi:MAG: hypothetical protein IPL67_10465 [Ignavibacteria bacterium]|nr:hypothetical protein [Ignavibacteria bacterium]